MKHENEEWVFLDQVATTSHLVKTTSMMAKFVRALTAD
jgi:hypothetical protein